MFRPILTCIQTCVQPCLVEKQSMCIRTPAFNGQTNKRSLEIVWHHNELLQHEARELVWHNSMHWRGPTKQPLSLRDWSLLPGSAAWLRWCVQYILGILEYLLSAQKNRYTHWISCTSSSFLREYGKEDLPFYTQEWYGSELVHCCRVILLRDKYSFGCLPTFWNFTLPPNHPQKPPEPP